MHIRHAGQSLRSVVDRALHRGERPTDQPFQVDLGETRQEAPTWLQQRPSFLRGPLLVARSGDDKAVRGYEPLVRPEDGAVATLDLFLHTDASKAREKGLPLTMFRRSDQALPDGPSKTGLASLHVSGSGEFTEEGLHALARELKGHPVHIFDLREETHAFANGLPVSRYTPGNAVNQEKPLTAIFQDEEDFTHELLGAGGVAFKNEFHGRRETGYAGVGMNVRKAVTEKDLADSVGMQYHRLNVTDNHAPRPQVVDRFVDEARQLPADAWVHFHCVGGRHRTTTFMAMYDMMHNARDVSFEDILSRQHLLGGVDLGVDKDGVPHDRQVNGKDRYDFLKSFYTYCRTNDDGFATPFSASPGRE